MVDIYGIWGPYESGRGETRGAPPGTMGATYDVGRDQNSVMG